MMIGKLILRRVIQEHPDYDLKVRFMMGPDEIETSVQMQADVTRVDEIDHNGRVIWIWAVTE